MQESVQDGDSKSNTNAEDGELIVQRGSKEDVRGGHLELFFLAGKSLSPTPDACCSGSLTRASASQGCWTALFG